jgi:putative ABC transport system permease protein
LRNLMRHRLRSLLTLLGVVFGTGAVVAMLGIGEGAQRTVLREIAALGLQNIYVDSVEPQGGGQSGSENTSRILRYGLTSRDVERIATVCPEVTIVPAHLVEAWVACRGRKIPVKTFGVSPEYLAQSGARLVDGRAISPSDIEERTRMAWVTPQVFDSLRRAGFIERDAFTIGAHAFKLAGVVNLPSVDDANTVLIPYSTAKSLFGTMILKRQSGKIEAKAVEIGRILVRTRDESSVPRTATLIQRTMEFGHAQPDYRVSVPLELLRSKQRSQRILNGVLISIASISLLVGGIGIMNIMLAIVTERIPEVGLRRALGARRRDILLQFLVETVALSTFGGIAGCLLGWAGVRVVSAFAGWAGVITPLAIILSLGVSWAVGVVFGLAPAVRAARMDPVKALRYE